MKEFTLFLHTADELLKLSKKEKNARKRIRLLAVSFVVGGESRTQVAKRLQVSRRSVNVWMERYLDAGLDGLEAKKQKGNESYLSEEQKKQLIDYIDAKSRSTEGGRLIGKDILNYINEQFGVSYHHNSIYQLLHSLGFSWITSRSKHPKHNLEAQEEFKKNFQVR